jgi:hypothetical protein
MKVLCGILNARKNNIVDHISRNSDHKEVSKTLIEDVLRRDSGIAAAQDNCVWALTIHEANPAIVGLVGIDSSLLDVPFIAFEELSEDPRPA